MQSLLRVQPSQIAYDNSHQRNFNYTSVGFLDNPKLVYQSINLANFPTLENAYSKGEQGRLPKSPAAVYKFPFHIPMRKRNEFNGKLSPLVDKGQRLQYFTEKFDLKHKFNQNIIQEYQNISIGPGDTDQNASEKAKNRLKNNSGFRTQLDKSRSGFKTSVQKLPTNGEKLQTKEHTSNQISSL